MLTIIIFFSIISFFFTIWIIFPPPTLFLLPLGVIILEISPYFTIVNSLLLLFLIPSSHHNLIENIMITILIIGIILSLIPLIEISKTIKEFDKKIISQLGENYLHKIPTSVKDKMRWQPFNLLDIFRGINKPKVKITRGIEFAKFEQISLTMNVYQPLSQGINPTLIIIYGGAWSKGSPDNDETFSCYIAHQGYTVITVDYRHAPKYHFPIQLQDINTSLKYIKENWCRLGVNLAQIGIMGRSAGGQLAFLTAYQPQVINFKALINYYAPMNLTQAYQTPAIPDPINTRQVLENFLGGNIEELPQLYYQASPINYIQENLPPTLLIYGKKDHIVPAEAGKIISEKLTKFGNNNIFLAIPWTEHAFDAIFFGISNQLALYYTERFLAFFLH